MHVNYIFPKKGREMDSKMRELIERTNERTNREQVPRSLLLTVRS